MEVTARNVWSREKRFYVPDDHDKRLAELIHLSKTGVKTYVDSLVHAMCAAIAGDARAGTVWPEEGEVLSDPRAQTGAWIVGGAHDGVALGINDAGDEADVRAAAEILRECIAELRATSEDPVCIGFVRDDANGICYFDVANVFFERGEAMALGRARSELVIYDLVDNCELPVTVPLPGAKKNPFAGPEYDHYMRVRHNLVE